MALTPKQEKFAQVVASGKTLSAAYRAAYNVKENTTIATINNDAHMLMKKPEVSARVNELRVPIEEQVGITLHSYIDEMHDLKRIALEAGDHGPATKALENVGKCLGYYVTKTEVTANVSIDKMDDEELDKRIAEKLALLKS